VERDPRLLRQHLDRAKFLDDLDDPVKGGAHLRGGTGEVPIQVAGPGARVGLSRVGEGTAAARALPHRPLRRHGFTVAARGPTDG
jgi:hypothetical protein